MTDEKRQSIHVVPIFDVTNVPINMDHHAQILSQSKSSPIFPQWLIDRKDFQTFFPRFGTKAWSEDEKLRMAAQKDPDIRNGIDIQLLSKWLVNVPSLKALNVVQAGEIAKRMRWVSYAPNQYIFKKGDVGDACYILVNGEVNIIVNNEVVGSLTKGMNFGEVALQQDDARRTADIQVTEDSPADLLVIRGEDYQKNVYRYQSKRRKKLTKWLRTEVSIFRDFSDNKLRYLEAVSIDLFLHPGNCVYMEGEEVGALYIVKSGTISLEKNVLFETKHRRPTGVNSWAVQAHKTHIQVPSFQVDPTGCFGVEYFVKVPNRTHTAVVKTEAHLVVINRIDCVSSAHSFSAKSIEKLCERYRTIWNATRQSTTAQIKAYHKAQKVARGNAPERQSPMTVRQKHPETTETQPNLQFPALARTVWTASNHVVASAQKLCYPSKHPAPRLKSREFLRSNSSPMLGLATSTSNNNSEIVKS